MRNPWLDIPQADYEGHMALPQVAQAGLLADIFETVVKELTPASLAVLGCSGGNGFDGISPSVTERVVGVDINPEYVEMARTRFKDRFHCLELFVGDLQADEIAFVPVHLVFAALVFEHMEAEAVLERIPRYLRPEGTLVTVVQLPTQYGADVTPSPYGSVQTLSQSMKLVPPGQLRTTAALSHFEQIQSWSAESRPGKRFEVQSFRLRALLAM